MATSEVPHEAEETPTHELPLDRAEALLDQMGQRLGQLASRAGRGLLRATARAREEAEDMWAEARSIRQNNRHGSTRNQDGQH